MPGRMRPTGVPETAEWGVSVGWFLSGGKSINE